MKRKKTNRLNSWLIMEHAKSALVEARDGLPKQRSGMRRCLRCDTLFYSQAACNRICNTCKEDHPNTY